MFTLTSLRSPSRSATILSSTGATAWQGPHHSAQKSTITGLSLWRTSCSKLCSVTAVVIGSFLANQSVVPGINASNRQLLPSLQSAPVFEPLPQYPDHPALEEE